MMTVMMTVMMTADVMMTAEKLNKINDRVMMTAEPRPYLLRL
jgi:hypothetical protein